MDKIKIIGGNQLNGKIYISGAKNAALPLICAALLTNDKVILKNVPALSDITFLNGLLKYLGIKISEKEELFESHISTTYTYQADEIKELIAPYDFVRKMRASYYVLGPLLARFRHAELSLPGGCAIGARPIDIHLSSLEQMGAKIEIKNGYVVADAPEGLSGAHIIFSKASVGATCNILMAATLANGTTRIENAAKEPEISNLIDLLNLMGAKIEGRDTSILTSCTVPSFLLFQTESRLVHTPLPRQLPMAESNWLMPGLNIYNSHCGFWKKWVSALKKKSILLSLTA